MSGWVEEMSEPVHSNRKNFKCENCDFETDQKIEFLVHKYNVHGLRLVQERGVGAGGEEAPLSVPITIVIFCKNINL